MLHEIDQSAQAVFSIKSGEEIPFSEVHGGPRLTRASYGLVWEGDLAGEGVLEEMRVHFTPKRASVTGLQRFTGKLGDLQGTFVLKHEGQFVNGTLSLKMTVVPGSGTEALKGLRAEITVQTPLGEQTPVSFHYHFA